MCNPGATLAVHSAPSGNSTHHDAALHQKAGGRRDKRRPTQRRANGLPTTFNPNVVGQKQFVASLASSNSVSGRLYAFFQHSSYPYCDHNVGEFLKTESNPTYLARYFSLEDCQRRKVKLLDIGKLGAKLPSSKVPSPPVTSSDEVDTSPITEVISVTEDSEDDEVEPALRVDDPNHGPLFTDGTAFKKVRGNHRKPNSVASQVATIEVWLEALSLVDPSTASAPLPRTIDLQKKKDIRLALIVDLKRRHLEARQRIYKQLQERHASLPPGTYHSPLEPLYLISDRRLLALVELLQSYLTPPFARAKQGALDRAPPPPLVPVPPPPPPALSKPTESAVSSPSDAAPPASLSVAPPAPKSRSSVSSLTVVTTHPSFKGKRHYFKTKSQKADSSSSASGNPMDIDPPTKTKE
ncbi:hypothetical protein BC829DRAFT_417039 [Chytridium lagenaria]|nr:hypothetical protein BC829DRAFT_417039 [Chytridium lagenaria]